MARSNKSELKKERILKAALKLFSEKGYHSTTTKEIASESGVAEGLIFYYFGDKRELLKRSVRHFSFHETIRGATAELSTLSIQDALVRFGQLYLSFLDSHRDYIMLVWSPNLIQDQEINQDVMSLIAGMAEQGGQLLAPLTDGTPEQSRVVTVATSMLLSTLIMYFIVGLRMNNRSPQEDESYIRNVVHVLLNGVR